MSERNAGKVEVEADRLEVTLFYRLADFTGDLGSRTLSARIRWLRTVSLFDR